jgi:hypothetical protein
MQKRFLTLLDAFRRYSVRTMQKRYSTLLDATFFLFYREHNELEESRKVLAANNLSIEDRSVTSTTFLSRPNSRGRSVSVMHPSQGLSSPNTLGANLVILAECYIFINFFSNFFCQVKKNCFANSFPSPAGSYCPFLCPFLCSFTQTLEDIISLI